MGKLKNNQTGFTAVEGLLIVLILAVIGAVGYMVYHNDHKTKIASVSTTAATKPTATTKSTTSTSTASTVPNFPSIYNGWNSYCISSVGLCLKYPQGYNLEDCKDGPSPNNCGIETKDVRNGSASFPVVSWGVSAATSNPTSGCSSPSEFTWTLSDITKLPYISNLYLAKATASDTTDPYFNGEVSYDVLSNNIGTTPSASQLCNATFFPSKNSSSYILNISGGDGTPNSQQSSSQTASYDQTITQMLSSLYYK